MVRVVCFELDAGLKVNKGNRQCILHAMKWLVKWSEGRNTYVNHLLQRNKRIKNIRDDYFEILVEENCICRQKFVE